MCPLPVTSEEGRCTEFEKCAFAPDNTFTHRWPEQLTFAVYSVIAHKVYLNPYYAVKLVKCALAAVRASSFYALMWKALLSINMNV